MSWYPFEDDSWEERDVDGRRGPDPEEAEEHPGAPPDRHAGWRAPLDPEGDLLEETSSGRWPLDPRGLYPRERWLWFEQLWADACMLRERYRVGLRSGWWEDPLHVEALAALAAWVERYDSGEWDDPPGKLALLYDLERVSALLRDGLEPFHPGRDRGPFLRYLIESGCQPPPQGPSAG